MGADGGARFGEYELLERIGAGGMAEVHRARQIGPHGFIKPCVIKRIQPEHTKSEQHRRHFLEEARISALLNHPHIVQTFDFGEVGGVPYLAMELVEGASLSKLMRQLAQQKRRLPPRAILELGAAVADALDYAHRLSGLDGRPLNLVHRDVSPENVLLSREGAVKLADFGIARHDARELVTQGPSTKGKPGYMAPEQALGEAIDGRTDLFSLAIVLAELLSGERLLTGQPDGRGIARVPERVAELAAKGVVATPDLVALLRSMADLAPERRPRSAAEVAARLRELARSLPEQEGIGPFLRTVLAGVLSPAGAEPITGERDTELDLFSGSSEPPAPESPLDPDPAPPALTVRPRAKAEPAAPPVDVARLMERLERPRKSDSPARNVALTLLVLALLGVAAYGASSFVGGGESSTPPSGSLTVSSEPTGARVWIDGSDSGLETPAIVATVPLAKLVTVEARKPGYLSFPAEERFELSTADSHRALHFELKPGVTLRIHTQPPGARVELENRPLDRLSPVELPALERGSTARIRVELAGHLAVQKELRALTSTTVVLALEPASTITIDTEPSGARVTMDGTPAGTTPLDLAVPLGRKFRVVIERLGYLTHKAVIDPRKVREARLQVALQELSLLKLPLLPEERKEARRLTGERERLRGARASAKSKLVEAERNQRKVEARPQSFVQAIADAETRAREAAEHLAAVDEQLAEVEDQIEQVRGEVFRRLDTEDDRLGK